MTKIRSSIALVVGCVWALGLGGAALAADMGLPVKAPPPPAPPPLDIHGFVEWDWESFLINPSGQALINHGTVTTLAGLDWVLYKNTAGFINKWSVGGLVAADWSNDFPGYWAFFEPSANGDLFDVVMAIDSSVTFGQYWTLTETYFNVYSGDVGCNATGNCFTGGSASPTGTSIGFGFLNFNTLRLTFSDSFTGWPITFNPYVEWYYEFKGQNVQDMPACFDCQVGSEFFIGMTPTVNFKPWGVPWLTLKVPTYVTIGTGDFFGCPSTAPCNSTVPGSPGSSGDLGVFTIGLTAIASLTWIPSNYGNWYAKAGFQWYDVINDNLIASNAFSICGFEFATCPSWDTKSIFVGFAGLGVAF